METKVQYQEQFQCEEVYISDMLVLKNLFLQIQKTGKVNPDFGIPFLLAKKKSEVIAFASLVISENGGITFNIYNKSDVQHSEKKCFISRAEHYFKNKNTPNFRNPEQLKNSIYRMVSWLNQ
ncbi:hypothetical protein BBH99_06930 [Chryseobacterium contaminans]|uniref:Uncharacterized protein n=1 Tax=Chryseobacterium contaminans TaxID=1423959 RepID=A0A1M6V6R6_9FLAO|nr:hypothetical protein [Chryseobacterium contaminans]OCA78959.1 hypothetical protein BBH99_06930 [Chryseobacterium contaminans]SHK77138.1 hypothetical protein SAMN05444407_10190 [Chryseobacterium contaminans]